DPNYEKTIDSVDVSPSHGAQFYRLNVTSGMDALAVKVSPTTANSTLTPTVILLAPDGTPTQPVSAAPGATLFFPIPLKMAGTYDLYVAGTTDGDPVKLQVGQLKLPTAIAYDQLPGQELDLAGNLSTQGQITTGFGSYSGA